MYLQQFIPVSLLEKFNNIFRLHKSQPHVTVYIHIYYIQLFILLVLDNVNSVVEKLHLVQDPFQLHWNLRVKLLVYCLTDRLLFQFFVIDKDMKVLIFLKLNSSVHFEIRTIKVVIKLANKIRRVNHLLDNDWQPILEGFLKLAKPLSGRILIFN
jgi:hypothetical protein